MTDFLLDPALVVDLLVRETDPRRDRLLASARTKGDGLWLAVSSMPELLSALEQRAVDVAAANLRLKAFAGACTWLGAPAGDGDFVAADDRQKRQLRGGLERLAPDARLLVAEVAGEDEMALGDYLDAEGGGAIPFIDLPRQQRRLRAKIESGLLGVLAHGRYIGGPEIEALEARLAAFVGVRHAVAVSNGTDALLIALMAAGIGPGDEVVTSPFTFAATGEMIQLLGARPVYVDIDPDTYNIDPARIEDALSTRTRAIVPVSIFGQCADMDAINAVAARRGIAVIEDGAQSFGATYQGRRSCGLSLIGCTSFFPSKPLGGYGDSGACFTDDDGIAEALRQIHDHGQTGRYRHTRLGLNGRMSSFQAAILLAKLDVFEEEIALRADAGARYDALFAERLNGLPDDMVVVPRIARGNTSVYAQYSLLVPRRDEIQARLGAQGVPTAVHYPVPLNRQPALRDDGCEVPVAEDVSARVLSVPMHPYISEAHQTRVADAIAEAVRDI